MKNGGGWIAGVSSWLFGIDEFVIACSGIRSPYIEKAAPVISGLPFL